MKAVWVFFSLLAMVWMGCLAPSEHLPRAIQQQRAARRVDMYRVLGTSLGAAGDGYTFLNERFRFEFSKEFDEVQGYRTSEERFQRGKAASDFLNGGYDFVRNIFGIQSKKVIRVVISPALDGNSGDAKTQISWQTINERIVEGSEQVTMYFGMKAFESQDVLAHELTHALTDVYALPAWLSEGIATLVELDYAKGAPRAKEHASLTPIGLDEDGYNILQTWRGDKSPLPFRNTQTYAAAYAIVAEIRRRYGQDIFARLFQDFQKTKPHLRGKRLTMSDIIAGLNRVIGKDIRPFFEEIRFRIE